MAGRFFIFEYVSPEKLSFPYYFGFTLVFSCHHSRVDNTRSNVKDTLSKEKKVSIKQPDSITSDTTAPDQLLRYTCLHQFSDPNNKDVFSIALYGKSIDSGKIVFKITDHTYNQIYSETFPASDLLGDLEEEIHGKEAEDTIKKRTAAFLDTRSFYSPAIDPNENAQDDFENADKSDISNWKDVKSDTTSVKFIYSHGYEGTYGIAYSKKKKKVVQIFYSD